MPLSEKDSPVTMAQTLTIALNLVINNISSKWRIGAQGKHAQHTPCHPSPMMQDFPLGRHCLQLSQEPQTIAENPGTSHTETRISVEK